MFVYWLVLCVMFIAQHLPLKLCYGIASVLGEVVYRCWPEGRGNVLDNMRHVLGQEASEKEVQRVARCSFVNYMKLLVDFTRIPCTGPAALEKRLKSKGWEHLDKAFEHGKGVILVATHMGSWEVAGVIVAGRGYATNAVSESLGNERINRLAVEFRSRWGIRLIPMEYALKRVYRALRDNEAVAIVPDRPLPPTEGTPVDFFGERITWPTGPALLALRTGAKIITGYLARNAQDDYVGELYPALEIETTGDEDVDVQRITQQIVRIQEDLIGRFPDQWYMFRRMWSTDRVQS
jgi:lauroyl/myristoyl acyltransferase